MKSAIGLKSTIVSPQEKDVHKQTGSRTVPRKASSSLSTKGKGEKAAAGTVSSKSVDLRTDALKTTDQEHAGLQGPSCTTHASSDAGVAVDMDAGSRFRTSDEGLQVHEDRPRVYVTHTQSPRMENEAPWEFIVLR